MQQPNGNIRNQAVPYRRFDDNRFNSELDDIEGADTGNQNVEAAVPQTNNEPMENDVPMGYQSDEANQNDEAMHDKYFDEDDVKVHQQDSEPVNAYDGDIYDDAIPDEEYIDGDDDEATNDFDDTPITLDECLQQIDYLNETISSLEDRNDKLTREWESYRQRIAKQREEEKVLAAEKIMLNLLPILDDFDRSISYAEENGENGLLGGVVAMKAKMINILTREGIVELDPQGEAFDAIEAQAVATIPNQNKYDETVAEVYQKGYKLGDKVLRPAMVSVYVGGPKRPISNDD